ncbi:MAG: hypothetical protein MI723_09850 [Caulobacterales bacterium]|nr:hypothetical protein [Caulobacterales bacterium]
MTDRPLADAALYRLLTWLSPSYPVGAYTYSHGLEAAFDAGLGAGEAEVAGWIADVLTRGGGFADAVFLRRAHDAAREGDADRLAGIAEFARAFAPTEELLTETLAQGAAFVDVTLGVADAPGASHTPASSSASGEVSAASPTGGAARRLSKPPTPTSDVGPAAATSFPRLRRLADAHGQVPYPVAVGCAAAEAGVPAQPAALAYAHAFAANLVSASLRLAPIGQTAGQRILAALEPAVAEAAERARATSLDRLTVSTLSADLCSMAHETQYARLFRS